MANNNHQRRKKVPVVKQLTSICTKHNEMVVSKISSYKRHEVVLSITPTEVSRTYLVKIVLSQNRAPMVYVLSPNLLEENKQEHPPHMYSLEEGKLCLFLPGEISVYNNYSEIVPWISEWLMYYETWKITGVWYGRGHGFEEEQK